MANPIDLDPNDAYPVEISIASPSGYDSLFTFNGTYSVVLSDSNFNVDATFNSDGSINTINSITTTTSLVTGYKIGAADVLATLVWQTSGNSGHLNALTGDVELTLSFKLKFTGTWKGGSETCQTAAFTVDMGSTSSYTYPYTGGTLHGTNYNGTSFRVVSNGFGIPAISGTSCTAAHVSNLANLGVGAATSAGMKVDNDAVVPQAARAALRSAH